MKISIYTPSILRASDAVRFRPAHIFERLVARLGHVTGSQSVPRGNVIASDTIIQALLTQNKSDHYSIVAHPWHLDSISTHIRSYMESQNGDSKVSFHSLTEWTRPDGNGPPCDIWFAPLSGTSVTETPMLSSKLRGLSGRRDYPIVTMTHGLSHQSFSRGLVLPLILEGSRPWDSLLCTSSAAKDGLQKIVGSIERQIKGETGQRCKYNGRIDKIPLCVDTELFRPRDKAPIRRRLKLPQDAIILLILSRLSPLKADLCPLLGVLKPIIGKRPRQNIIVVLAGGADHGYLQTLLDEARTLGIAKRIRVFLNVSEIDKRDLLSASDVFVSTTDTLEESCGLTPIEAMASGVPQVVSDWSGYRDTVVNGRTGFLIPTYWTSCDADLRSTEDILGWVCGHLSLGQSVAVDLPHLRQCLEELVDSPELRNEMGCYSRKRAEESYSYPAVAAQYAILWQELTHEWECGKGGPLRTVADSSYCNLFSHYPSHFLDDQTPLAVANSATFISNELRWRLPESMSSIMSCNPQLLAQLLGCLQHGPGPMLFGELVDAAESPLSKDVWRRHVMWLIKYGFVEALINNTHSSVVRHK